MIRRGNLIQSGKRLKYWCSVCHTAIGSVMPSLLGIAVYSPVVETVGRQYILTKIK